jgi:hypothetical protein
VMIDGVLPWLKLGALIAYVVVVFRWVRGHAAAWPWNERKGILLLLTFCVLPILYLYAQLKNDVPTEVLSAIVTTLFATVIASFFAIILAPELGSVEQGGIKRALLLVLQIAGAFLIPMMLVLGIIMPSGSRRVTQ